MMKNNRKYELVILLGFTLLTLMVSFLARMVNANSNYQPPDYTNSEPPVIVHIHRTGAEDQLIHKVWYYPNIDQYFIEYVRDQ